MRSCGSGQRVRKQSGKVISPPLPTLRTHTLAQHAGVVLCAEREGAGPYWLLSDPWTPVESFGGKGAG